MAARSWRPDMQWFLRPYNSALRVGVLIGACLSCAFIAWLLIANRAPHLVPFAGIRNLAGAVLMILLLSIPVFRFHNEPGKLFVSGLTAWALLALTYLGSELAYSLLESRMGALQIFMLGSFSYGLVAVFDWVFLLCAEARHRHISQSGGTSAPANRFRGY
jgi:hypothetical protein